MKLTSKSLILFIPLLWMSTTSVSAQTPADTTLAHQYYVIGDSLFSVAQFDSATVYFRKATYEYKKTEKWERYFECLNKISKNYWRTAKFGLAMKEVETVLNESPKYLGNNNLQIAGAFKNRAVIYGMQGKFNLALSYTKKALNLRKEKLGIYHPDLLDSYLNMGLAYKMMGVYDSALDYNRYSMTILEKLYGYKHHKTADIYSNIGLLFQEISWLDSALKYSERALTIRRKQLNENHPKTLESLNNIADLYAQKGYHEKALEFHLKALRNEKKLWGENHFNIASNYHNIGIVFLSKHNYDLALEYFQKELSIRLKNTEESHPLVADSYYFIALAYFEKEENHRSIYFHKKALHSRQKSLGKDHFEVAKSYNGLAQAYLNHNDNQAEKYLKNAIDILEQIKKYSPLILAYSYSTLANIFIGQNNYDSAAICYERSLDIMRQGYGDLHPGIAATYNEIGDLFRKRGLYEESLSAYNDASIANNFAMRNILTNINGKFNNVLNLDYLLSTLLGSALTTEELAASNVSLTDLKSSLTKLQFCDTVTDEIRHQRVRYNDKVDLGKSINEVYESAIRVSLKLYELTDEIKYKNMAFYFAERNKASLLSESLSDQSAKSFGLIPDSLLMFEKHLKIDLSYAQSKRQEAVSKNDSSKIDQWQDKLFTLNRSNDSLIVALEENYPQYHKLKYKSNTKNIDEIQSELDSDQVLIEYFVADSITCVFAITKDKYEIHQLPINTNLNEVVGKFRASLNVSISGSKESYGQLASELHGLYDQFLDPVLESLDSTITKLIVVSDGALSYVPFEILLTQPADTNQTSYQSLDYLLNKYQVQYGYSASLQFHKPERKSSRSMNNLISFAPVYDGAEPDSIRRLALGNFRANVSPLKWNQPEVENISEYFEGTSYKAEQATEKTFKEAVKDNSIVHLSMHAFVDDQDPMNSKLVFTQDNDSIEDGFLYAHEIYNMNLKAQMVVLSACETGFGKLAKGEGIMSLGRAFSYAGCPSMVMSHWNVNDQATSRLMNNFYKHLSLGETKDEALRNAKLDFLQNSDAALANPFFWGSFVVTGDTSPIRTKNAFSQWLFIAVIGLLILVFGGFYIRKK